MQNETKDAKEYLENIGLDAQSMLRKRERNGGIIIGYHGTSATRAKEILEHGFKVKVEDNIREEVFAYDQDVKGNATGFGKDRARRDGDTQYVVFKIEMKNPRPDYSRGVPGEWRSQPDSIKILETQYFPVDS